MITEQDINEIAERINVLEGEELRKEIGFALLALDMEDSRTLLWLGGLCAARAGELEFNK